MPAMTVLEQSRRESKLLEQLLRNNASPINSVVASNDAAFDEPPPDNIRTAALITSSSNTSPPTSKQLLVSNGSGSLTTHSKKPPESLNVKHGLPPVVSGTVSTLRSSTSSYMSTTSSLTSDVLASSLSDGKSSRNSNKKSPPDANAQKGSDSGRESSNSPAENSAGSSSIKSSPTISMKKLESATQAGKPSEPRRSIVAFTASTKKGSPERPKMAQKRITENRAASEGDLPGLPIQRDAAIGDPRRSVRYAVKMNPTSRGSTASSASASSMLPSNVVLNRQNYLDAEDGDGSLLLHQLEYANTVFDNRRHGGYNLAPLTQDELQERVQSYQRRRRLLRTFMWIVVSIVLMALFIGAVVLSVYFVETRYRERDDKIDMNDFYDDNHPPPAQLRHEIRTKLAADAAARVGGNSDAPSHSSGDDGDGAGTK